MKKIASLLLTIVLLLSLAACGENKTSKNGNGEKNSQTKTVNNTNETSSSKEDKKTSNQDNNETNKPKENEISFTEVVVVDNAECSIKITQIDSENLFGFTLKSQLENKSAEKTYMFSIESGAINGVECDPLFATKIAAGKKSNNKINFLSDNLKKNEIGDYTDIELTFRVYDSNDWTAEPVAKETIHIYPYGEDRAVKFVRSPQPNDNVIIDNDSVTVIVTGYEEDKIWGYKVNLFLINKTDKNVMFSVNEASINGFMADPFYATTVSAGKCAFSSMSWTNRVLKDNGISAVEKIEFKFRIYDSDDWTLSDIVNETITLKP